MGRAKTLEHGNWVFYTSGDDLGECDNKNCSERGFSYNEDGRLLCEEHLEQWCDNQEEEIYEDEYELDDELDDELDEDADYGR